MRRHLAWLLRRWADRLEPQRRYPYRYKGMYRIGESIPLLPGETLAKTRPEDRPLGEYFHAWVWREGVKREHWSRPWLNEQLLAPEDGR